MLSRSHWAYLRKHYPYQRFTLEWRKTSTMVASKVFAADGTPQAIVTTFLLDCRIRHEVEPYESVHNDHGGAEQLCPVHEHCDGSCGDGGHN